jgi:hypothetical protein
VNVQGVSWIGLKTGSFDRMARFFKDTLCLVPTFAQREFTIFGLPNGDKIELFGPEGPHPLGFFEHSTVVPGLFVTDIARAKRELEAAGVELLGPTMRAFPPYIEALGESYSWQHLRAPDGTVMELCSRVG